MKPPSQTPLPTYFRQISMVKLLLSLFLVSISLQIKVKADRAPIAKPGCPETCGNVRIPFPFGIGSNCSLDSWYTIDCNSTTPFLSQLHLQVLNIVLDVQDDPYNPYWGYRDHHIYIQNMTVLMPTLKLCTANTQRQRRSSPIDLRGSPFNFSMDGNALLMKGCAGSAVLVDQTNQSMGGCSTICHNDNNTNISTECYGVECCQTQLPPSSPTPPTTTRWFDDGSAYSPLQFYNIDFYGQSSSEGRNNCMAVSLIKNESLGKYGGRLQSGNTVPVEFLWSWVGTGFPDYDPLRAACHAFSNNHTHNTTTCMCTNNGYGNPYVFDGCQVPDQCRGCHGFCARLTDSIYSCRRSYSYQLASILMLLVLAVVPLALVFCCCCLHRCIKRKSKAERKVKMFKLKLQQHQSTCEGVVERTKLFTHKQLDKATNHFNEDRVLGKGGQGIVYKGMLGNGRTVAVKKLKRMDASEMEQFINEVVILSQIDHRNVVKLLGCCLEIDIPLLVYEFISNGTLSQHIHDPDEDFDLSWALRLKIAAGAAGAIAYLHSYSSIPIYHRDIKSSNILLDDKYRAKVSDFGSSKTTSIDQTHLTTLVRGTTGYLDPEYFLSNQFTDKSDVYSFGVVLLELLTGKKPIYRDERMEQKSLVSEFLYMTQNARLFDILDPQVVKETNQEEMVAVADLAKRCLNASGRLRPTMKEVAMILEMIIKSPVDMHMEDQQSLQGKEFDEYVMSEIRDVEFMTNPLPIGVGNSLCIDVQPLLRNTI